MKIDFRLKDVILQAHSKVNETALDYIKVLNDFKYDYNENLDTILDKYANDVFDEMMENDKSLILRAKGAIDKLLFKDKIIKDNGYRINERISKYHKAHAQALLEIRKHIRGYMYGESYKIGLYQFKGSKIHKLFEKFCNGTYENFMEVSRIVVGDFGISQEFKVQPGNRYIRYDIKNEKPRIIYDDVDVSNPDWVKLVDEITL